MCSFGEAADHSGSLLEDFKSEEVIELAKRGKHEMNLEVELLNVRLRVRVFQCFVFVLHYLRLIMRVPTSKVK